MEKALLAEKSYEERPTTTWRASLAGELENVASMAAPIVIVSVS